VTTALTNLTETQPFQCTNRLSPRNRGSLGIACLKDSDDWAARIVWRKLFEIKLGSLAQIGDCFFDSLTLTDRADLRTLRYVQVTLSVQYRGEGSNVHESAPVDPYVTPNILRQGILPNLNRALCDLLPQFDRVEGLVLRQPPQDCKLGA